MDQAPGPIPCCNPSRPPKGNTTKLSYDATGALTSITDALGHATSIPHHTGGGLPETVVDANGVSTDFSYDVRQRLISSAISTSAGVLTTRFSYDAAGDLTGTTLPGQVFWRNPYDFAHRLTGISDLFGNSIAYTLDALGDRTQTNTNDPTGAAQRQHSRVFDALGRVIQDIWRRGPDYYGHL